MKENQVIQSRIVINLFNIKKFVLSEFGAFITEALYFYPIINKTDFL